MTRSTFACAALVGLGAVACDAPGVSSARALLDRALGRGAPAPAAPAPPLPAPAAGPPRAPADTPLPSAMTSRRFAGGRPIAWWSERLTGLRRSGPEELYRLTLSRARLNGLDVVEGPAAVTATTAPVEASRAPATAPGARP
jgi:hypothetical protein